MQQIKIFLTSFFVLISIQLFAQNDAVINIKIDLDQAEHTINSMFHCLLFL